MQPKQRGECDENDARGENVMAEAREESGMSRESDWGQTGRTGRGGLSLQAIQVPACAGRGPLVLWIVCGPEDVRAHRLTRAKTGAFSPSMLRMWMPCLTMNLCVQNILVRLSLLLLRYGVWFGGSIVAWAPYSDFHTIASPRRLKFFLSLLITPVWPPLP